MKLYRIRNRVTGLYYKGRAYSYDEMGKLYTSRTVKLAWKNMVRRFMPKEAYDHVIEEVVIKPVNEIETSEIDNI